MSWKVSKSLVLVFIFLLKWLLLQNVISFGVKAAALETGLEIESLKTEQKQNLKKREGHYEKSGLTYNFDVTAKPWNGDKANEDLRGEEVKITKEEGKGKRFIRNDSSALADGKLSEFEESWDQASKVLQKMTEDFEPPSITTTVGIDSVRTESEDKVDSTTYLDEGPSIIMPSSVFYNLDIEDLERLQAGQRRTHDTLVLKYIQEDFDFDWGDEKVLQWIHFKHLGQGYYIGRRLNDLLMVIAGTDKDQTDTAQVVNVGQTIIALETYSYWNFELNQQEGVIVAATSKQILWYRHNPANQQFELYGNWTHKSHINHLEYFSKSAQDYMIVCSNDTSLEIFNFSLTAKKFRRNQTIPLESPCREVILIRTANEVLLAVPQVNKVNVYGSLGHSKFLLKEVLASPGFHFLQTFKVGGQHFLAFGGEKAQIFRYHQDHFETQALFDSSFGFVDFVLPIKVGTFYRDDLLLLVQHEFLNLTSLEVLTWNGQSFENNLAIACHRDSQLQYGATSCLSVLEEAPNLKGAAILKSHNDISLIVPSLKGKSRLFHFHTEILPQNSELLELEETFDYLKAWVKERDDLVAQAEMFLETPLEDLSPLQDDLPSLNLLETPELQFSGEVQDIYLNDYKWSAADTEVDLNFLINSIEDLEKTLSAGRQRRQLDLAEVLHEELNFDVVMADELEIENLNGRPFYIQDSVLDFPGIVNFTDLEVLEELVELKKRQLEDDFVWEGDLEFDFINDFKWEDLKGNMVLRTENQALDLLKVEGEVIVEENLQIKTLNSLAFPGDYLLSHGPRSSIVRAEKYFNNTLSANSVDTDGLINGQNPVEAITLMDRQEWQGSAIFNHLEVSEKLELHGTAHGRNVANSPLNPTLKQANIIEAHCIFEHLEVNGPIVMKGDLNEKPLGELLKDILPRPEDPKQEIEIPSPKSFGQVIFPIDFELENNTINHIESEKFATIHTRQLLDLSALDGYVYFYNLTLKGLYDGVKMEDVVKEVITLDKPLDLSNTQLIFEDTLHADSLIILDKINNRTIKDNLQTLDEDLNLETAEFEELNCKTAVFSQDIRGRGKLNNIELHSFVNERSWHEPPVQGNLFLNELYVAQGLQADELHGLNAEHLLDFLRNIDTLPEMVLSGQIQVDHITVTGNVKVHQLNGQRFDEDLQTNVIWLKRANVLATTMIFQNPLEIKGNLVVEGRYQGHYMPDLMEDIIRKEANSTLIISAPKSFLRPVYVLQNSQVEAVNGINFQNIALKTKENLFRGALTIKGKLLTSELQVQGQVNGHDLKDLENIMYYDQKLKNFVLKNEIIFENPINLEDLTVQGDFNDLPNLSQFFENLVDLNSQCYLQGNNTFTGRVSIQQGAFIHDLNSLDLNNLFENLIFIQNSGPVVLNTPLVFEDSVKAGKISVHNSLKTKSLNGCPLAEWLNDTLRVDQDQYIPHFLPFSAGSLDGNSLNVHFINDLDLSRIVTLFTPQEFNDSVEFSEVYLRGVLEANGSVNGVNLEEEYNNTLMIYGGQHITTPLTIQSIKVLQDFQVRGIVNGNKNLNDVATLDGDLELQSPIYFQSLYSPLIVTKDLVTGIDFRKWFETTLRSQDKPIQYVTGNWSARALKVKSGPYDFQYNINGFEPWEYNDFIRSVRSYDEEELEEICVILKEIWKKIEEKTVLVKHLEKEFSLDLENITRSQPGEVKRRKLFYLKTFRDNYLLLNVDCWAYLYKWNSTGNSFEFLNSYESGPIAQITVIPNHNSSMLQFVTNYETTETLNCSFKGVNVWHAQDKETEHRRRLPFKAMDMQSSNQSLWLLSKNLVTELDLNTFAIRKERSLNFEDATSYRFVKLAGSDEILLSNGVDIVSLADQHNVKTKAKKEVSFLELPSYFFFPSWLGFPKVETTSYLKTNASMARKFAFSDFKQVLERLLLDLSEKLNQQINITQLSIPESDLFDEHLIPDFVALMEQLQQQQLLPREILNITFEKITLPENPAQVLAARVLQIVWPAIEELEEIHGYLKDNSSHNHPLCGNITKSLASLMSDVLREAHKVDHEEQGHVLFKVIERIRHFDKDLHKMVATLKTFEEDKLVYSASNHRERVLKANPEDPRKNFFGQEELISLKVGSVRNTRRLLALTKTFTTMTPGEDSSIYLYGEDLRGNPYQIIHVHRPHSLIELRLKQETLLMFIENCCQVQVWRYQGTQGFVKFMHFDEDREILQILSLALTESQGNEKHLLGLLMEEQIKFYEIVVQGITQTPPELPCT